MLRPFIICLMISTLAGCAAGITRTGYAIPGDTAGIDETSCKIAIKFQAKYSSDKFDVLGTINSYETGLSTNCGEISVLTIFYKDACALKAAVINILEEKRPDYWSTCYRAKAELLRLKDGQEAQLAETDEKYSPKALIERAKEDDIMFDKALGNAIDAGTMGGMIGGGVAAPLK